MTNQLKSILNNFHDLLFVFDEDGVIIDFISSNHEEELILPRENFVGRNQRDVLPDKVSNKLEHAFSQLDQGKEQYRFDYSLKLQEEKQWYNAILSKISHNGDSRYLGAVRNITERKSKELLLRGILNTSPGGIMVLQTTRNTNGKIIDFVITQINKSVETLTGLLEDDLIGENITEVVADDAREEILDYCKTVLETGNPVEFQYQQRNGEGQTFWYHCKVAKYREGVIGNFLDISKQKRAEEELAEKNESLKELNRQKDKLFSVVSHDLRNAIAGAKGVYDMVLEDYKELSKDEIFEYLSILNQRTHNTHELLEDLLDWSKNQFQEVSTNPQKLHLASLTTKTLDNVRSHADSKEIKLLNKIPDGIYVYADANMIKTVLRNLITNGIKFTNPGGEIGIYAEKKNQKVRVSVQDDGIGMDEETQKKVMNQKTNYTSQGTNGEKGSGVGLDLCIDFIEKNGGEIWVESEPGQGSTFSFTLRRYSEAN